MPVTFAWLVEHAKSLHQIPKAYEYNSLHSMYVLTLGHSACVHMH